MFSEDLNYPRAIAELTPATEEDQQYISLLKKEADKEQGSLETEVSILRELTRKAVEQNAKLVNQINQLKTEYKVLAFNYDGLTNRVGELILEKEALAEQLKRYHNAEQKYLIEWTSLSSLEKKVLKDYGYEYLTQIARLSDREIKNIAGVYLLQIEQQNTTGISFFDRLIECLDRVGLDPKPIPLDSSSPKSYFTESDRLYRKMLNRLIGLLNESEYDREQAYNFALRSGLRECLLKENITNFEDLRHHSLESLLKIKNFGKQAVCHVYYSILGLEEKLTIHKRMKKRQLTMESN